MEYLEDVVRNAAGKPPSNKKKNEGREISTKEKERILEEVSYINNKNRKELGDISLKYASLDRREAKDSPVSGLLRWYNDVVEEAEFNEKNLEEFHEGIRKIIEISSKADSARLVFTYASRILKSSKDLFRAWVESLTHISLDKTEGIEDADFRLKRYGLITSDSLKNCPPHLEILAEFSRGASVYGLEKYLLDITKAEEGPPRKVKKLIDILGKVPLNDREVVEHVRSKVYAGSKEFDREFYEMLEDSIDLKELVSSSLSFFSRLKQTGKKDITDLSKKTLSNLRKIIKIKKRNVLTAKRLTEGIVNFYGDHVVAYLDNVASASQLGNDEENDHYLEFVGEMYKDYLGGIVSKKKDSGIGAEVLREKCEGEIRKISALSEETRGRVFEIVKIAKNKRSNRLAGENKTYIDQIVSSYIEASKIDPQKAYDYLVKVLVYRKPGGKNGQR